LAGVPAPRDAFDGPSFDASLIWGRSFGDGAGHLELYGTYHKQNVVLQGARDFSACQINVDDAGKPFCNGTTNSNIFYLSSGLGDQFAVAGNQFAIWDPALKTNPPPLFNSNAFNTMIQADTRWTAGYFAHWDFNPHVTVYSDFQYMHDKTDVPIAPSGLFQGAGPSPDGGFLVNCNNPLLSAQQVTAIGCTPAQVAAGDSLDLFIGRRNVEGGPRASVYRHENYRVVLGARGTITGPWKYDIYASYYHTTLDVLLGNYVGISRAQDALQVVQGPNGPVCIVGGTCVPYNIFTEGGVTPAALEPLLVSARQHGTSTERIIEGVINGDLGGYGVRSPWATDGVSVAAGFQFRRDELTFTPDAISSTNELSGGGGALTPVDGAISVKEGFAELRAPLAQDLPYAHEVQLEAGYRYSSYSTGFTTDTWKAGLQWAPTQDIRLRSSYQVAVRAPNILELFTPRTVTNTSQLPEDPCAAGASQPATLQQCLNTGITPAQYGVVPNCPSNQCAVLTGGNANLQPEHAKTVAVGFTLTPRWIDGLTASVDYYHIKLRGTIGAIPLGVTVQRCLDTGLPQFCSLITRTSGGTLFGSSITTGGFVDGSGVNIGAGTASGVDVQGAYSLPLSKIGHDNWGRLTFNFAGSYLINFTTTPLPDEAEYDCAGLFGPQCQTVNPRWRHTMRVNWQSPWDVLFSVAWRHFGGAKLETDTNQPTIGQGTTDLFNHTLPSRDYMDLSAIWNMNKVLTLRAGVNNLLDQDPPLVSAAIAGTGLPNTFPTYDLLGRRIFVGFTARF
jgi:outer membrane receptor protein involved in Fe transport